MVNDLDAKAVDKTDVTYISKSESKFLISTALLGHLTSSTESSFSIFSFSFVADDDTGTVL